jgi:hypothetical protein
MGGREPLHMLEAQLLEAQCRHGAPTGACAPARLPARPPARLPACMVSLRGCGRDTLGAWTDACLQRAKSDKLLHLSLAFSSTAGQPWEEAAPREIRV